MERQMTLAEINDELGAARTKKEFFERLDAIIPWEFFENYRAVLLQEKVRRQPLSIGIDATDIYSAKRL